MGAALLLLAACFVLAILLAAIANLVTAWLPRRHRARRGEPLVISSVPRGKRP